MKSSTVNTRYIILYPSIAEEASHTASQITVPEKDWIVFDGKEGTEKLWIVWSDKPLEELEAVKGLVSKDDKGLIQDNDRNQAIAELLKKYSASRLGVEKDEGSKKINIKAKGDVIVYTFNLEHW